MAFSKSSIELQINQNLLRGHSSRLKRRENSQTPNEKRVHRSSYRVQKGKGKNNHYSQALKRL